MRALALILALLCASPVFAQSASVKQALGNNAITVQNGLVGYWRMDSADLAGSLLLDRSGNGNNGTLTATSVVLGEINNALSFNGTSSAVVSPVPKQISGLTANITIAAWINRANNVHGCAVSVGSYTTGFAIGTGGSTLDANGNNLVVESNSYAWVISAGVVPSSKWAFIAARVGGGSYASFTGYINGVAVASNSSSIYPAANGVYIGENGPGIRLFAGSIDDVRVYDRALSSAEISEIYAAGLAGHQ